MTATLTNFPALWSLEPFKAIDGIRSSFQPGAKEITRYPIKYLRYWFVRNFLEAEAKRLARPLNVLEVGVDRGQMLAFMGDASTRERVIGSWTAVDVAPNDLWLSKIGYGEVIQHDVDFGADPCLHRTFDAVVFLHVLEHLQAPEETLKTFLRYVKHDGIVVGGCPTMPSVIADLGYERRLRRKAKPFGHVSVISPERIEQFVEAEKLHLEFLSGAYLARKQGAWIENFAAWMRLNVAFGAVFPSLGSEIYFQIRRPFR